MSQVGGVWGTACPPAWPQPCSTGSRKSHPGRCHWPCPHYPMALTGTPVPASRAPCLVTAGHDRCSYTGLHWFCQGVALRGGGCTAQWPHASQQWGNLGDRLAMPFTCCISNQRAHLEPPGTWCPTARGPQRLDVTMSGHPLGGEMCGSPWLRICRGCAPGADPEFQARGQDQQLHPGPVRWCPVDTPGWVARGMWPQGQGHGFRNTEEMACPVRGETFLLGICWKASLVVK